MPIIATRRGILAAGVASLAAPALAQPAWPGGRPIEVIVGFAPGGGTDVMVRALTQFLSAELPGSNFVVVNRPGAGGETAYVALQTARPDGYTLGTINTPGYLSLGVQRRVRYDRAQIRLIARLVDDPSAFVVHRDSPYRSLRDLVEAAKRRPGTISVGSSGIGTDDHLGLTLFEAAAGVELIHVPFAGAGPSRNAVLGRQIDVAGLNLGEIGMLGQENPMLRALAGMGERRWELMPDVPTFREEGFNVLMSSERGIGAPRGIPDEVAGRLEDAIAKVIATPEWAERVRQLELAMAFLRGAEWEAQMPAQLARYQRIWERTPWQ
ncbi:tripartite tricarboxylate transporter substrate binding protein [Neoroseomonas oryzicola]|uniref:Tripartite tricarboxylate transporter substrate binding protein n=1 Tax=Neoroseomonas oryzicola TaxID=535904 RepID=A0A9X9WKT7_9PROT|nr:tripartite tricarboxylate transporter substrate binding protein [Neoroseomonas oryzicola]MBR0660947.1 tripartite tricarboxylate transporter substrate binding protein [Neoroseomonas oryzicola]NKE19827.1 tripartite tricarboxylate transporter substrate binding protein [Neoroseomonas oryzicola]